MNLIDLTNQWIDAVSYKNCKEAKKIGRIIEDVKEHKINRKEEENETA